TIGGALAGDQVHLVVAIEMVLVGPVADFRTLEQVGGDGRIAGSSEERREPVQAGEEAVLHCVRWHMIVPAQDCRHTEAALHDGSLALREWCRSAIGPSEGLRAVV